MPVWAQTRSVLTKSEHGEVAAICQSVPASVKKCLCKNVAKKKERIFNEWIVGLIGLVWLKTKLDRERNGKKIYKSDVPLRRVKRATHEWHDVKRLPCSAEIMTHLCICSQLPLRLRFPSLTYLPLKFFSPHTFPHLTLQIFFLSLPPLTDSRLVAWRDGENDENEATAGWKVSPAKSLWMLLAYSLSVVHASLFSLTFCSLFYFFPTEIWSRPCATSVLAASVWAEELLLWAAANVAKPTIVILSCRINSHSGEHRQ